MFNPANDRNVEKVLFSVKYYINSILETIDTVILFFLTYKLANSYKTFKNPENRR